MRATSSSTRRGAAGQAGFTLIELLIAIVVLLVGIVAVAELVPAAIRTNFRNRNDSTALIAAQRLLEQMARQDLDAQGANCIGGALPPAGQYSFCDDEGAVIALGQVVAGTVNTQDGCPLDAPANQQLDFTQPAAACPGGYRVVKQWIWNPTAGTTQRIELRWHVVTMHDNGVPVRKVFIVGARRGQPGEGFVITNLVTIVGR
ncbi:MAG: prepilin-type N-terminal cleavage/methylation domain-containing protein [Terriglobia bacterium]